MPVKRGLYRFRPLAGLLRGALNRAAPQGFTPVVVAAGGLQGLSLSLDLQEEKDYWLGTYEPDLQAAVAELVQPGMLVYDVGANIGYISLLLARRVGESGPCLCLRSPARQPGTPAPQPGAKWAGRTRDSRSGGSGGAKAPGAFPGRSFGRDGQSRRFRRSPGCSLFPGA